MTTRRDVLAFVPSVFLVALSAASVARGGTPPSPPADAGAPLLVWDVPPAARDSLPRNLRSTDQPIVAGGGREPSTLGLSELRASGSGQFSGPGLERLMGLLPARVTVFDLRQETHVFVNGLPVSWYATNNWANVGRPREEIEGEEGDRCHTFVPRTRLLLSDAGARKAAPDVAPPVSLEVADVQTEAALVRMAGAAYVRITVSDHARPTDVEVDRFLLAVRELPPEGWAHFHCRAGRGRTTTFLALYDMLRNAHRVSLEDIARRQELLAEDYDVLRPAESGSWKAPFTEDRIAFVRAFYAYARENPNGRPRLWTEWLARP
jgi:protein-tyrosine phosphatase